MNRLLIWTGRFAGLAGFLVAVAAVLIRLGGQWRIGDLSVGTLLNGGVAAMVAGTLAYAAAIAERDRD